MSRVFLDDARWFDKSAAQAYKGRVDQGLYRTRKGAWVLRDVQDYRVLQERQAFAWLLRNGYADNVPAQFIEANEI